MKDIFSIGELFNDVQVQNIFADGKTFVDCTPNENLSSIVQKYDEQRPLPGFNLLKFVTEYFTPPKNYSTNYTSEKGRPIDKHIEMLWDELTRQREVKVDEETSLIPLPHSYVVPGGRFREIYYWDSYFTMLGLQVSGKIDMIQSMVDNFAYLIDKFGYIPNGNRTYFLGRSQPPFYASIVKLLSEEKGGNILVKYLPQLEKEYTFWMNGMEDLNSQNISIGRVALMPDKSILNHYWDEYDTPRAESYKEDIELAKHHQSNEEAGKNLYRNLRAACESGWDFSSRWFMNDKEFTSIHTTDIIPIDLNCLLFNLELTLAEAYHLSNNEEPFNKYQTAADNRKNAINKYCWHKEERFYFDYDYVSKEQKKPLTLAATFPLFFKMATAEQAEGIAKILQEYFLCPGGLQTTIAQTGQQWDSPNGWAPLQWIAVKGLKNYDHDILAKEIAIRWMNINEEVYKNTGKMMEKYNVVESGIKAGGGEYPSQDGFGWTNGVYLALKGLIKE